SRAPGRTSGPPAGSWPAPPQRAWRSGNLVLAGYLPALYVAGLRKIDSAGMPDDHRTRLVRARRADLAEGGFHLVDHQIDDVARTFGAERAEPPQKRLAGERPLRAERHRTHHVEPRADAGIEHHGGAAADGTGDGGKDVDRRRQAFDLASAVARHHEPVDPDGRAFFRIGRMQDALHHQRTPPALAIARDLVPG